MPVNLPSDRRIQLCYLFHAFFQTKHGWYFIFCLILVVLWLAIAFLHISLSGSPESSPPWHVVLNGVIGAILGNALWGMLKSLRYLFRYKLYWLPVFRPTFERLDPGIVRGKCGCDVEHGQSVDCKEGKQLTKRQSLHYNYAKHWNFNSTFHACIFSDGN